MIRPRHTPHVAASPACSVASSPSAFPTASGSSFIGYYRPGGVDRYKRPDGISVYKRP